jgi:Flp pilus assembly protein CpaB
VAGYIQAGDYISVIAIVPSPKGQNVRTIYTNVHVLKVGPAVADKTAGAPKTGGISSSLTVIVTACQAEYLNWFLANASLRYILESYKDTKPQDTAPDQSCPSVTTAPGVRQSDVANRWPGIFAG